MIRFHQSVDALSDYVVRKGGYLYISHFEIHFSDLELVFLDVHQKLISHEHCFVNNIKKLYS
jgi:hypothetical protein